MFIEKNAVFRLVSVIAFRCLICVYIDLFTMCTVFFGSALLLMFSFFVFWKV